MTGTSSILLPLFFQQNQSLVANRLLQASATLKPDRSVRPQGTLEAHSGLPPRKATKPLKLQRSPADNCVWFQHRSFRKPPQLQRFWERRQQQPDGSAAIRRLSRVLIDVPPESAPFINSLSRHGFSA